jgi:dihydropteroate synthase
MTIFQALHSGGRVASPGVGAGFAALLDRWRAGGAGRVPLVMGIVNVTPDSFYDGGRFESRAAAVRHARRLVADGAAMLDVGGESTRKDAAPVSSEDEKRRVLPVIEAIAQSGVTISIDTMKAEVAEAALEAGANIVNDIRGLQGDSEIAAVAARHGAGVIAMQNPGILGSAEALPGDPIAICKGYFERSLQIAGGRHSGGPDRARSGFRLWEVA